MATVVGKAKHELVERALAKSIGEEVDMSAWSTFALENSIKEILKQPNMVLEIFAVESDEATIRSYLLKLIPILQNWSKQYLSKQSQLDHRNFQPIRVRDHSFSFNISSVVAVEEMIVSPLWGIKGQLDVTVKAKFHEKTTKQGINTSQEDAICPIEVKTGKMLHGSHHIQVMLYALLAADRYNGKRVCSKSYPEYLSGVLLHIPTITDPKSSQNTKSSLCNVDGVAFFRNEIMQLLHTRNKFASAIALRRKTKTKEDSEVGDIEDCPPTTLPNVIKRDQCNRCFSKQVCMTYHTILEKGNSETSGVPQDELQKLVGHLDSNHQEYFKLWNTMLDLESSLQKEYNKEIWTLTDEQRESKGRCIGGLRLESCDTKSNEEIHSYRFTRIEINKPIDCDELQMDVGEYIQLSAVNYQLMLATGNIVALSSHSVTIETRTKIPVLADRNVQWRIDKNEMVAREHLVRLNLMKLFVGSTKFSVENNGDERVRNLVVGLHAPKFVTLQPSQTLKDLKFQTVPDFWWDGLHSLEQLQQNLHHIEHTTPSQHSQRSTLNSESRTNILSSYHNLNTDQQNAVYASLCAQNYLCIQGMPGTGKTTTIGFLICALRALGKSVLVTSYTHSAVDNLLSKVGEIGVPFVRLGSSKNVHPNIRKYTLEGISKGGGLTVAQLENMVNDPHLILGATCLAMHHPIIERKRFDYCIIDEAGQLTQPVSLGPFFNAKVAILVGDHEQLPPLVRNPKARELGMDNSLFKRLCEAHPNMVSKLATQFRMNKEIMSLANELVYQNMLVCGNVSVSEKRMLLDGYPANLPPLSRPNAQPWLKAALHPNSPVIFLDTDAVVGSNEARIGFRPTDRVSSQDSSPLGKIVNEMEVLLIRKLVDGLIGCGAKAADIGVISPYRSQLRLLRKQLSPYLSDLEVQTVDRYQGRDKICIIISLVRSNDTNSVGTLLQDWRRVNVAFTRAKCKLIVIGSRTTLKASETCSQFITLAGRREWIYPLQANAMNSYETIVHDDYKQKSCRKIV